MMELTRRKLLQMGLTSAAGLAVPGLLAGCSKGSRQEPSGSNDTGSLQGVANARLKAGAAQGLSVFLAGSDFAVGIPNYVGFGLVKDQAGPVSGGDAQVWLAATADPKARVAPIGPYPATWQGYSHPQVSGPQGINAADLNFDQAGTWTALVEVTAPIGKLLGSTALTVLPKAKNKAPGDKAIPSMTPTVDNHRGVEPICTRKPACPFHQVTIASALKSGKPVAFIFGTPAFCESRTCGPNLEELIAVSRAVGDRAVFIHAEVYKDDKDAVAKQIVSPTFKKWGFESEPWIYFIDKTGTIKTRYEGPVTTARMQKDLTPLLA